MTLMRSEFPSVPSGWNAVLSVGGGSLEHGFCLHPSSKEGGQDSVTGRWAFEELGEEADLGFTPLIPTFVSCHCITSLSWCSSNLIFEQVLIPTFTRYVTWGHPLAISVPQIPHLAMPFPT